MEAILGSILGIIFAGIITALVKIGVDSMIVIDKIEDEEERARKRALIMQRYHYCERTE